MEVGEARSECYSEAPPREPKAREARFGQVFARRTLRLTGKSATADFRLGNPRHPAPGAVGQRSTELGGNTPSPTRSPPKKTPHGPPISSQSGYQRALQRRGVGGRGGPSDSLFLALPGALRARLASRRGRVCVPAAFRPPCRGAPFPAASLFKTWFYFSASAGSCRRSPCSTASWPAPAPARRSP